MAVVKRKDYDALFARLRRPRQSRVLLPEQTPYKRPERWRDAPVMPVSSARQWVCDAIDAFGLTDESVGTLTIYCDRADQTHFIAALRDDPGDFYTPPSTWMRPPGIRFAILAGRKRREKGMPSATWSVTEHVRGELTGWDRTVTSREFEMPFDSHEDDPEPTPQYDPTWCEELWRMPRHSSRMPYDQERYRLSSVYARRPFDASHPLIDRMEVDP